MSCFIYQFPFTFQIFIRNSSTNFIGCLWFLEFETKILIFFKIIVKSRWDSKISKQSLKTLCSLCRCTNLILQTPTTRIMPSGVQIFCFINLICHLFMTLVILNIKMPNNKLKICLQHYC